MNKLFFLLSFILLQSCMINDEKARTVNISNTSIDSSNKEIFFINDSSMNTDMAIELSKYGFKVKAFASQQKVTDKTNESIELEYNEASARYGIEIKGDFAMVCAFTNNIVYDFTITLIDIDTNEMINAYKQRAPDGNCTTLTPIYELYAKYLNSIW